MIKRTFYINLWKELSKDKQMIFLSGPRQVGKTTLAKDIAKNYNNHVYFNWDVISDKRLLIENPAFFQNVNRVDASMPLVVFDEIHKYPRWKNYLKGIYDQFEDEYLFLVSGSGRLDIYQKGGDSLAGRYFMFHLFPFTVSELSEKKRDFKEFITDPIKKFDINDKSATEKIWRMLSVTGGFPEPFVKGTEIFFTRWSTNYFRQILREDIRDFADLKKINTIEMLFSLLPTRVGSPFSINNVAQDLQVAFDSVKNWLKLFEMFYLTFRIPTWTKKISRAILKEQKLYLFNYSIIKDEAFRFENMVALELLRAVYNWNEYGYGNFSLHYIRNKDKQEVDFLIAQKNTPLLIIETKLAQDTPAKSLLNFQSLLNVPAVQLVNKEGIFKYFENGTNKTLIITAHRWLSSLPR
ncbi:MAG: ATP-binding protein [Candidatus Omnitrophota bacterium]